MSREAVFVRIPKNATTSIEGVLTRHPHVLLNSVVDLLPRDGYPDGWSKRGLSALWIEALGTDRWDRAFKFTFARNPYDRAVSSYKHAVRLRRGQSRRVTALQLVERILSTRRIPEPRLVARWISGTLSFAEFLEIVERDDLPSPGARWHSTPQSRHVTDDQGNLLVDFVGKFESLQEDFDRLCSEIGIDRTVLPALNASRRDRHSYRDFYSPLLMEKVRRIYHRDFELLGYDMDSLGGCSGGYS